jgi:flagellar hook-associated protein 3 FlgL
MRPVGATFLSQQTLIQTPIRHNQSALARAQVELATQRHSDMLQQLAGDTGRNIRWHAELANVDEAAKTNALHATRATVTQASLQAAHNLASEFLKNLVSARGSESGKNIIQNQAKSAFDMLRETFSTEINGDFLFSGRNTNTAPLKPFFNDVGEAQFDSSFMLEFGFAKNDPAMTSITNTQLGSFLDNSFEALFATPNWEAISSNASSENINVYLGKSTIVDLSANVNEEPVRKLFSAVVAVSELASANLNDTSFQKLIDVAAEKVSSAMQGITLMQARVGISQKTLTDATQQLQTRKAWLNEAIARTESVDTYEIASRINALSTQLEASYSITSRMSRISLLNYL